MSRDADGRAAGRVGFDLEAVLAVPSVDPAEVLHEVQDGAQTIFTWDYSVARPALRRLYEKAKAGQWNGETDLPWYIEVDQASIAEANRQNAVDMWGSSDVIHYAGSPVEHWTPEVWTEFGIQSQNWMLSQFLHGEQGALLCTAKIVETVPWHDAKLYAASQVVDEARHVEVFSKYLDTKLSGHYPINPHLRLLLDDIIADARWDMTYLGMQIMVEGLALAAFGFMHQLTAEPLLKQLLRYVMSDEARHVAFGVLSLREAYEAMTDAEIRERQEFAFEASVRMRDRLLQQEVWEHMGVSPRDVLPYVVTDPSRTAFQQLLFAKIVPNCRKLGLLDRNGGWLRQRFAELGVIGFEHLEDTGDEYAKFALDESAREQSATVPVA